MRRQRGWLARATAILVVCGAGGIGLAQDDGLVAPVIEPQRRHVDQLVLEVGNDELVPVLVHFELDPPFQPEGTLSEGAVSEQRSAISGVQERLVDVLARGLPGQPVFVARGFETVPFLALDATGQQIRLLASVDAVVDIVEDIPTEWVPPMVAEGGPEAFAADLRPPDTNDRFSVFALLDAGVVTEHPEFQGRVLLEACYSGSRGDPGIETLCPNDQIEMHGAGAARPPCPEGTYWDRFCDHGTAVASLMVGTELGIAPYGHLIAIQVYSRVGGARRSYVRDRVAALDYLMTMRSSYPLVAVNISVATVLGYDSTVVCAEMESIEEGVAASNLSSVNVAVVAASGNGGFRDRLSRPACHPEIISVSGVDSRDDVTETANAAEFLDFYGPGWAVLAATRDRGPQSFNGTSYASPIVAGLLGLRLAADPVAGVATHVHDLGAEGVLVRDCRSDTCTSAKPRVAVP